MNAKWKEEIVSDKPRCKLNTHQYSEMNQIEKSIEYQFRKNKSEFAMNAIKLYLF